VGHAVAQLICGARSGTELQIARSRFRLPMVTLT